MSRFAAVFVLAAVVVAPALRAQTAPTTTPAATSACLPTTTLEELIKALDDAVSGPADKDRSCLRQITLPETRLIPLGKNPDGSFAPHALTVDDWIAAVAKRGTAVFYERQIKVKTETFGHIAHLWSTYEVRPTLDGKATVTGINSIQAVYDGTRWKVVEILWQAGTTAEPVPEKYLP